MAWEAPFNLATALHDASDYAGSGDLLDKSPNGHDGAISGSTFLAHPGTNYVWFTPVADTNVLSAALDVVPSVSIGYVAKIAPTDVVSAANQGIFGSTSADRRFELMSTSALRVLVDDGSNQTAASSATLDSVGVTDGSDVWVRALVSITNSTVDFYYSVESTNDPDAVTWTALGTQQAITIGTPKSTATLSVGAANPSTGAVPYGGKFYVGSVAYDGVEVWRVVPSDIEPSRTALDLDGTGDYASVPHEAAFLPTDEIDVRVALSLPDWTPAATTTLIGKIEDTNTREWRLDLLTGGDLQLSFNHTDGTAGNAVNETCDTALTFAAGAAASVRGTIDFTNGAATVFNFYVKDSVSFTDLESDSGWRQVGSVDQTAAVNALWAGGTSPIEIGSVFLGTAQPLTGRVLGAVVKDAINGTTVLGVDFTDQTPGAATITAETGQTVTLVGDAAIVPDGQLRIHDSTPTHLDLPGASGDGASMPTTVSTLTSGVVRSETRVICDDTTPAADLYFAGGNSSNGRIGVRTTGDLRGSIRDGDNNLRNADFGSFSALVTPGRAAWVKVDWDIDAATASAWYSLDDTNDPDAVSWSVVALGVAVTYTNGLKAPTTRYFGTAAGAAAHAGALLYQRHTWDGTVDADVDFTTLAPGVTSFTEDSTNAATVTIAGNASIAGGSNKWDVNRATSGHQTELVDRAGFKMDAVDDWITVPHSADLNVRGDFTAMVAFRQHSAGLAAAQQIFGKSASYSTAGWSLLTVGTSDDAGAYVWDGAALKAGVETDGALPYGVAFRTFAMRVDATADELEFFIDGVSIGSPTSVTSYDDANASDLRIGADAGGAADWAGMYFGSTVWGGTKLTDAQILTAHNAYKSGGVGLGTNLELGDLSEADIQALASLAGVTVTSGEVVGKLNQIAGTTESEYVKALIAAAAAAGVTYP